MVNADFFEQTTEMKRKKMILGPFIIGGTYLTPAALERRREEMMATEAPGDVLEPGVNF